MEPVQTVLASVSLLIGASVSVGLAMSVPPAEIVKSKVPSTMGSAAVLQTSMSPVPPSRPGPGYPQELGRHHLGRHHLRSEAG